MDCRSWRSPASGVKCNGWRPRSSNCSRRGFAEEIVIAFRDVTEYADLLWQIFPAAGIPIEIDAAIPLDQTPVIRALLLVLDLELQDWEFPRLHDVLRSPFFRPGWLFDRETGEGSGAVGVTLAALRRLQLGENRERILEVLHRTPNRLKNPVGSGSRKRH